MDTEKKEQDPIPVSQPAKKNDKRYIPDINQKLYEANLECFGPEMAKLLEDSSDTPVPIEDQVIVQGLKSPTFLVIIGFSGMQTLEGARRSKKEIQNVLIIEPSLSIFKQTIQRNYVGTLARDEMVDILVGISPDQMLPHLLRIFTAADRLGARPCRSLTPEIIVDPFVYLTTEGKQAPIAQEISGIVTDAAKQMALSFGCASDSHYRWEQMVRNEKNLQNSYRIAPLFDKFKDVPAIILGAGPSLEEFINAYHHYELRDRALIIACDASLRRLLNAGIRPHLVTRCERKYTQIFEGITREQTKDIYYAGYPWCDPSFFDLFESSFMLYRGNGVCKFTRPYEHGDVDGGVSSANAAIELAFLLGCSEIILSGIDLCFLDGKSHAEGTMVEFDPENSRSKWKEIPANNGEKVTSIPVWIRCLGEYRNAIFKHAEKGIKVFNTSVRGAQIQGAPFQSWEGISTLLKSRELAKKPLEIIQGNLEQHPLAYAETFQQKKKETAEYLKQVLADIEKTYLNIYDHMIIGKREEEKFVQQLRAYSDPTDYFQNLNSIKKNLLQLYLKPCNEVDHFKKKWYSQDQFCHLLLDICMIDYTHVENRRSNIANLVELEHDRLKMYAGLHMVFFQTLSFYAKKLQELFEKGADQTIDFQTMTEDKRNWPGLKLAA